MRKRILVFVTSMTIAAGMATAQPRIKVRQGLNIDLGKVVQGGISTTFLTLKNTGNQKLILNNIEVSCGCTGTVLSRKELEQGDTTSLLITFNSSGLIGPVHKSLTIHSNAEGAPRTVVDLSAVVVQDLSFSPAWFHFKDTEPGRKSIAVVRVKNESARNVRITGFRTQLPHFTLKYPRKPFPPGRTISLTAEFTPDTTRPAQNDAVFVTTSSEAQPELYIRVSRTLKRHK